MEQPLHSATNYLFGSYPDPKGDQIDFIPNEVLEHIYSHISLRDLKNVACTCKRANVTYKTFRKHQINAFTSSFQNAKNLDSFINAISAFSKADLPYSSIQRIYPSLKTSIETLIATLTDIDQGFFKRQSGSMKPLFNIANTSNPNNIPLQYTLRGFYGNFFNPKDANANPANLFFLKYLTLIDLKLLLENDYIFNSSHIQKIQESLKNLITQAQSQNRSDLASLAQKALSYAMITEVINNIKIQALQHATQQTPPSNTTN